jgi:energy-converting hydrogenase Eha subunit A
MVDSDDRGDSIALFVAGIALMLLNSVFVICIGVLMLPILQAHNKAIAAGYLGTRIFEGVVLALGVVSLIVVTSSDAIDANAVFYNIAEAGLGIGSLFF